MPYAEKFSTSEGLTDFALVPVHMKTNLWKRGEEHPAVRRLYEAEELVTLLPEVIALLDSETDIVIIGDQWIMMRRYSHGSRWQHL